MDATCARKLPVEGSPKLTLHQCHLGHNGTSRVEPLHIDSRILADQFAKLVVTETDAACSDPNEHLCPEVTLQRNRLFITTTRPSLGRQYHREVPLFMAEVGGFCGVGKDDICTSAIVLALPDPAVVNRTSAAHLDTSKRDVWVLNVHGGFSDVEYMMAVLSTRGAFRCDIKSIFNIKPGAIGHGAFSVVYRASPVRAQSYYPKHMVVKKSTGDNTAHVVSEVSCLAHLPEHPNVGHLWGFFGCKSNGDAGSSLCTAGCCLVFEHYLGGDLFDFVMKGGFVTEPDAIWILHGVLRAVCHLHTHGVVHRDVKAENIMLRHGGEAVLIDFGIAAFSSDEQEMGCWRGSPGYAAPEVCARRPYGGRADVFSCGVVLYHMLCCKFPFAGADLVSTMRATLQCQISFGCVVFESVSEKTKDLIRLLLRKSTTDRPSAEAALACVQDLLDESAVSSRILSIGRDFRSSPLPDSTVSSGRNSASRDSPTKRNYSWNHLPLKSPSPVGESAPPDDSGETLMQAEETERPESADDVLQNYKQDYVSDTSKDSAGALVTAVNSTPPTTAPSEEATSRHPDELTSEEAQATEKDTAEGEEEHAAKVKEVAKKFNSNESAPERRHLQAYREVRSRSTDDLAVGNATREGKPLPAQQLSEDPVAPEHTKGFLFEPHQQADRCPPDNESAELLSDTSSEVSGFGKALRPGTSTSMRGEPRKSEQRKPTNRQGDDSARPDPERQAVSVDPMCSSKRQGDDAHEKPPVFADSCEQEQSALPNPCKPAGPPKMNGRRHKAGKPHDANQFVSCPGYTPWKESHVSGALAVEPDSPSPSSKLLSPRAQRLAHALRPKQSG